jgi:hypothetical protein
VGGAGFRRGRSLVSRRLSLQAGTALRLSPGDGKWRRRCRPASRSSGRRQFAPAVLPCRRIEDEPAASLAPWRRHAAAWRAGKESTGRRRLERVGGLKGDAVLEFGAATARTPGSGSAGLRRVLAVHAMARWALGGPGDRAWSGLGRKQELGRVGPRETEGD